MASTSDYLLLGRQQHEYSMCQADLTAHTSDKLGHTDKIHKRGGRVTSTSTPTKAPGAASCFPFTTTTTASTAGTSMPGGTSTPARTSMPAGTSMPGGTSTPAGTSMPAGKY
ncbi:hypothetical protein GDO86_011939 [Hymenochirus boettgeri]|uniref:Uncharacterized protein n=1 Tax=Hymenochirus boettgeri TaxID=247094 RepID=A0A8T2JIK0_9PIPI|nr:hypothetical protein GDO86_011939 [Hymenochirus boettgeri]